MLLYLKLKYYVHHVCTRPWFCNEQFFFFGYTQVYLVQSMLKGSEMLYT